ncbi:MAG: PP2C family protein-serine/threonine phosphatase [bacterium]
MKIKAIQQALLPSSVPEVEGYEMAAYSKPARRFSGDYYDFIRVDKAHWGIVVADVSGKGIPASLVMATCRALMRTEAKGVISAAEVLRRVNRKLHADICEDMFITMIYMILNPVGNTLTCARAGHDAPFLLRNSAVRSLSEGESGMALGIDSGGVFDKVVQDLFVPLEKGDIILAYTDGASEAADFQEREFGRERIKSAMKNANGVQGVIKSVTKEIAHFVGKTVPMDDITLVALKKH